MDIPRVSSGFESIDSTVEGGYPAGSVVCILGNSDVPKEYIGLKFIDAGMTKITKSIFVSTVYTIPQIQSLAAKYAINLDQTIFVDAAQWRIKRVQPKIESQTKYSVQNLTDLNAILATIMQAVNDHNDVDAIFFHSPSSLLLYSTPGYEQIFKFFELLTAFTRSRDITFCFSLEQDVHEHNIISGMQFLADGTVEFQSHPEELQFRPKSMVLTTIKNIWTVL